jgi:deoxyribodipyrimidine photo-lyase
MHNRVRTIVASFLVKDFIWSGSSVTDISCVGCRRRPGLQPARLAVDGGLRYRRRAVLPSVQPEYAGQEVRPIRRPRQATRARAAGRADRVQEPWTLAGGPPNGYLAPIVDHGEERLESLRRLERIRGRALPQPLAARSQ